MFGIGTDSETELRERLVQSDARIAQLEATVHWLVNSEVASTCPQSRHGGRTFGHDVDAALYPFLSWWDHSKNAHHYGIGDPGNKK